MSAEVTRRDVLRASLAAGGGFLLELGGIGCAPPGLPAPVQPTARPGDFVPSAWIRITPEDKVYFTLDRVEMGQGTMTSHAQLVADELEIDPARFVIELAGADRSYDTSQGVQVTGGSTSVKSSFMPLRKAGAVAREMLRRAASKRFPAPIEECRAEDGTIVHTPSGKRFKYGELAADAARETIPEVTLKPHDQHTWIGKPITRLDARMKVDGSAVFGIDVQVPDMVTAVVIRPPRLEAEVVSIDDREARAMPGVVDVVRISRGVAVVARRYWQATRAAAAVKVTWSEGASWVDTETLRRMYLDRVKQPAKVVRKEGDVAAAEKGQRTIEATYELPYLAHATMEPQNATAIVTSSKCEVWAPTQGPALVREVVRRITGLPYEAITVHQTLLGGAFGRRGVHDFVEEAVEIALRTKKPVKVIWSREDDMRHSPYRPMSMNWVRGAVDARGAITGWSHRIVSQSIVAVMGQEWLAALMGNGVPIAMKLLGSQIARGVVGGNGLADPTSIEGASTMAYEIPNVRFEYAPMRNPVRVAPWRSVGNSLNVFTTEAFFDELARLGGKDPFLARRELLQKAPRNLAVLELAAEKAGWSKPLPRGRYRGIAQAKSFDSYAAHVVEVSVEGMDVRVHRVVSAVDCGVVVNPDLVRAQVESAIIFGLGAALRQEITFDKGAVRQSNFHDFEPLRMHETPNIEVHVVPSKEEPTGIGEPGVPPIAPAVANAILAATGRPVRRLPFTRGLAATKGDAK